MQPAQILEKGLSCNNQLIIENLEMKRKMWRNLILTDGDLNLIHCWKIEKVFEMVIQEDSLTKYMLPFVSKALEGVLNWYNS